MRKTRVASMFAGIGGICHGFKQANFEIVWANELDPSSCKTYRYNFENNYLSEGDIREIDINIIPEFDILTAGFPCQSFSIGGKQKGFNDNRGMLFFEVSRIIKLRRPNIIFLENVENLIKHDNGKTFLVIYNVLKAYGYSVCYKIMPTYEYGNVPQARKRIYILAFRNREQYEYFDFPDPIPLNRKVNNIVRLSEKMEDIFYYDTRINIYNRINTFIGKSQRLFRVFNGQIRNIRDPELCPTLTASMNNIYNAVVIRDIYGIRRLTLRESLDFQGFPVDYSFPDTIKLSEAYKQIGNSVSVPVIKRIADQIMILFR
jgi:DNA (cytosine-5)-methyltransferase 1